MKQDEIIEMAKQAWISEQEAQLITEFDMAYISCTYLTDLVAFAELVAAAAASKEREACAKVCEKHAEVYSSLPKTLTTDTSWAACIDSRDAIRARGEA